MVIAAITPATPPAMRRANIPVAQTVNAALDRDHDAAAAVPPTACGSGHQQRQAGRIRRRLQAGHGRRTPAKRRGQPRVAGADDAGQGIAMEKLARRPLRRFAQVARRVGARRGVGGEAPPPRSPLTTATTGDDRCAVTFERWTRPTRGPSRPPSRGARAPTRRQRRPAPRPTRRTGDRAEMRRPPTVARTPPLTASNTATAARTAARVRDFGGSSRLSLSGSATVSESSSSRPCGRRRPVPSRASSRPCRRRARQCGCRASAPSSASASASR